MIEELTGEFVDVDFVERALSEVSLRGSSFERCRFEQCRFESTRFVDCRFSDCSFLACDLIGVRFPESSLIDTKFVGGRAMGVDWAGVRRLMLRVEFDGVAMDYSNFTGLSLRKTVFEECRLRDAVFSECNLAGARFGGSDLTGAIIRHANLTGTDFRNTRGCLFHAASCTVKGTKIDADTALGLLSVMGVVCPDLDRVLGLEAGS